MIIETEGGRRRSVITKEERANDFLSRLQKLHGPGKKFFMQLCDQIEQLMLQGKDGFEALQEIKDRSSMFQDYVKTHYEDRLVLIEEFCMDHRYLGHIGKYLYKRWLADLIELFSRPYNEVIVTGSIGCGKCLDGDTEFYDPRKGIRLTLKEAVGVDNFVVSYNEQDGDEIGRTADIRLSGEKILGTMDLNSGKRLRLSPDHPVKTPKGWVPVGDLAEGSFIATARKVPSPKYEYDVSDEEVEFVAFMLAEGACSSGNWSFTNANSECLSRFESVVLWLGENGELSFLSKKGVYVKEEKGNMRTLYPRRTRWVQHKYNMYGTSHDKRVPSEFFGLSDRQLGLFLNRIWACDGNLKESGLEITLASELFIRDIQQLFLRFEIHSRIGRRQVSWVYNGNKKWSWAWRLVITGKENVLCAIGKLGRILGKTDDTEALRLKFRKAIGNTNVDIVPVDTISSTKIRNELGVPSKEWKKYRVPNGRYMGRDKFVEIEEKFGLPDWCFSWGNFFWDRLKSYTVDNEVSPVYDVEVPVTQNFITNGVIVHNTTFSDIGLAYMFYEICMLRDPQATYGLMPGSEIVLVCFNRDQRLARDVTFGGFKRKIEVSPFFQNLGLKFGTSELVYPRKNIKVIAVSARSANALGKDVFGGVIDETDFMEGSILKGGLPAPGEKSFAELLHESILRRMKSRYDRAGFLPGKLFLSSSARHKQSFTNRRISEASTDPNVFCRDYALYDVAPENRFSKERFWVLVGTERIDHEIISRKKYRDLGLEGRGKLEEQGCKFIRVPMNFRPDFERNIEDAIRDVAGVVTVSQAPFFQIRSRLYAAIDPTIRMPYAAESWITDVTPNIRWEEMVAFRRRRISAGRYTEELRPIRHPDAPRHVHIDLSLGVSDPAGICIAHIADMIDMERRGSEGEPIIESVPMIETDLILQILPPPGREIDFGAIRALIYDFERHGYSIAYVTLDSFQSRDMLQQLGNQGIEGAIVSVDKTVDPYVCLKTAFYEGRIGMYKHTILLEELEQLQRDEVKGKVDHPSGGSKDVADSLCGCVYSLTTEHRFNAPIMSGISEFEGDGKDDAWIRKTMKRSGGEAPVELNKDGPSGEGPIVFTG
jgi:intein/homing endonuclease